MSRGSLVEGVLGVTDINNVGQSLNQAHMTLTGEPFNPYAFEYVRPAIPGVYAGWLNSLTHEQRERHMAMSDVADIVVHKDMQSANTLADWPVYQGMLRRFGTKATGPARALMIGSLTALSSRAFDCFAREEYGADTTVVVDPKGGKDKARHGLFVKASGLELPFADGSMDFVHTNQLLHMLVDPSSPTAPQAFKIRKLAAEIARVVAPGGQVYMKEMIPNHREYDDIAKSPIAMRRALDDAGRLSRFIAGAFGRHGINYAQTGTPDVMVTDDYVFDPRRDFARYEKGINPTTFTVFAQKQPRSTPIAL